MVKRIVAGMGVGIVLLVTLALPASAHDSDIQLADGDAWVRNHHTHISVSDQICNPSSPVFVQYYVSTTGGIVFYDLFAPCGGTGRRNHHPQQITRYRLCVTGLRCTLWEPA